MKPELRARQKYLVQARQAWGETLAEIPRAEWRHLLAQMTKPPRRVWRSRWFLVQEFDESAGIIRLSVSRCHLKDDGDWMDDLTWDQLQRVKRECGYGDKDAVEVFPADADIVNVANMRHLWIMPQPVSFVWRRKEVALAQCQAREGGE